MLSRNEALKLQKVITDIYNNNAYKEILRIFTFAPLTCVSKPTVLKAKIHLNFGYLWCKAVFDEQIFVYPRHKIAAILSYYKIFNEG